MSIFVALHHVTHYKYDRPIDLGPQTVRLRPAPHTPDADPELFAQGHAIKSFRELAAGSAGQLAGACLSSRRRPTELKIEVDFSAQMTVVNPFDFFVEGYATSFPFQYTSDLKTELAPYLATIGAGAAVCGVL